MASSEIALTVQPGAFQRLRASSMSVPTAPEPCDVFVNPPSSSLICPIHLGLLENPHIAQCGHTFCNSCITESLKHKQVCPLDNAPLAANFLIPNLALKNQLQDILVYCKHGLKPADDWRTKPFEEQWVVDPDGCPAKIPRSEAARHDAVCDFKPLACPNSLECGRFTKKKYEEHIQLCSNNKCPNAQYGCQVRGTREVILTHRETCKYEAVKEILAFSRQEVDELKLTLSAKDAQIVLLNDAVTELHRKLENLADNVECKIASYDMTISKLTQQFLTQQRQLGEFADEVAVWRQRALDQGELISATKMFTCKGTISGHGGPIWAIVRYQKWMISASSDMTIKVWELQNQIYQCVRTLEGHEGIVHALVVKGNILFSGSSDATIICWDLDNNFERVHTIRAHDNDICTLAVSDNFLLSCSLKEIKVWDLEVYQCTHILTGHNHWVRALAVHQNRLYSGSYNMIKVWDLDDLKCIQTVMGQDGSVYSLCVHKSYLISGTYENTVQIWDLDTLQIRETLTGHLGTVYTVCVDPITNYLFSGSYDNTIKVWNLETLHCVQTLVRHTSSVDCLCWNKGTLFSGGADQTIKIWK